MLYKQFYIIRILVIWNIYQRTTTIISIIIKCMTRCASTRNSFVSLSFSKFWPSLPSDNAQCNNVVRGDEGNSQLFVRIIFPLSRYIGHRTLTKSISQLIQSVDTSWSS